MWKSFKNTSFFKTLEEKGAKEPSILIENLWDAPKALIPCALGEITNKHVLFISAAERESALFQGFSYC